MTNNFSDSSRMPKYRYGEVETRTWLRCIELDPDVSGDRSMVEFIVTMVAVVVL